MDDLRRLVDFGHPPSWASAWGEDQLGVFAAFAIDGVEQRMRWIRPGRFVMGSPESEPERFAAEAQHEVTLSRGFWLAETVCTQALWQVVMGENPSRFTGPDRPLEQVSWDDVQEFFARARVRGHGLRLPTEAEWEYACRAGTTTPFSFGNNITTAQVNHNGNYPYAEAAKGTDRAETVPVGSLPANAWGLSEMHGNVLEWCCDWQGDYPRTAVIDPRGPDEGSYRVLRGGSWFGHATFCRSAYRYSHVPSHRDDRVGFRLARGEGPVNAGAEPRDEAEREPGRRSWKRMP